MNSISLTSERPRLSVIIITKNAANNIEACLHSVAFADEVIVVDSGSTDATLHLARKMGALVHSADNWPGFGPQKNRALALARYDWVLSIDADERISDDLAIEIQKIVSETRSQLAFEIPRLTQFCGQWIRHCGWTPDHVLRLFKRDAARFSDDLVHERVLLAPNVKIDRLAEPLLHFSYPTPSHYWRKLEQYRQDWAQQRFETGRRRPCGVLRWLALLPF